MATDDIKISISADDKASGVLANIGKNVGGLGGALKGLATIAGTAVVAGFGAMAAFGVASVKEFIEAEKDMAVATQALGNALEVMSVDKLNKLQREVGIGVDVFEEMEHQMSEVGKAAVKLGIDDEAASVAFAKLFQVSGDLTQAQNDLKLAMDLSAFSGRDLESSAAAITKVHAGATRVLKEFGIELKDDATAAEALAALQERVTGTAEVMANTTAGKLQVLSVSWGNLKEQVGATLAEALQPFIAQLSDWAQNPDTQIKLQEIAKGLAEFIKQMQPIIIQVLPVFISLLGILGSALVKISTFLFKDLPDALGSSIFAVMKIIDAIKDFVNAIDNAVQKFKNFLGMQQGASLNPFSPSFKLPGFASGGIVPGPLGMPQLAVVHGGETVTPQGQTSRGLGLGGIVINITGTFLSEDAADKLASILIDKLKMELRI